MGLSVNVSYCPRPFPRVDGVQHKHTGAIYKARTRHEVVKILTRILDHGTQYIGDKAMEITVTREGKYANGQATRYQL